MFLFSLVANLCLLIPAFRSFPFPQLIVNQQICDTHTTTATTTESTHTHQPTAPSNSTRRVSCKRRFLLWIWNRSIDRYISVVIITNASIYLFSIEASIQSMVLFLKFYFLPNMNRSNQRPTFFPSTTTKYGREKLYKMRTDPTTPIL